MPIGAIVADESVMDWPPGAHANTFGGNPVACAAGLETLAVVEDENLLQNASERGEQLAAGLTAIADKYPGTLLNPRGLGLLAAFNLAGPNAEATRDAFVGQAFERGLLVLPAGRTAIRLTPPLIVGAEEVERALGIMDECAAATAAALDATSLPYAGVAG
jgi:4-aminobutyrate aminotransferase